MTQQIAALYVQTGGVYYGLDGVDPWDEARDARKYDGPWAVVAHPPCQLWGNFAPINYKRWGGEHNRPGNDCGAFALALALEHPARTKAWAAHGLEKPPGVGWHRCWDGAWVCEVWQSAYGHQAAKAAWLYYCGANPPAALSWARNPGTHRVGHDHKERTHKPVLRGKAASATPIAFRDALIALARGSR